MRIVLDVQDGEVTFTVRPAGQTTGSTPGMAAAQAGTGQAIAAGPAPQRLIDRPAAASTQPGRSQSAAPRQRASATSAGSRPLAAIDAGPAPRSQAAIAQAPPPPTPAGESFNLMGSSGKDAGPAPALRSRRRVTHPNGGKSK